MLSHKIICEVSGVELPNRINDAAVNKLKQSLTEYTDDYLKIIFDSVAEELKSRGVWDK